MHEALVNRLGGLSLPRKSVVRLTDCLDMTLDVYRGRKTTKQRPCQNDTDDDLGSPNFVLSGNDTFARFLVIKSQDGSNPVTSLSPFVIEKQIESLIGTPKSVKKLKNKTLLVKTNRKKQTENLLKITSFFNLKVSVSEHNTLNSSKGIIRDLCSKESPRTT